MSSYKETTKSARKDGIPAYIYIPIDGDDWSDDCSIGSISLFCLEQEVKRDPKINSTKLRTQSLPIALSLVHNALSMNSESTLLPALPMIEAEHVLGESHVDRPPKVPQRRRSVQTTLSCPILVAPASKKHIPARQALAA